MNNKLAQKAIKAALSGDWQKAIDFNKDIIQFDSNDIDALNRLARAYAAKGEIDKAKETSNKVLSLDPLNKIAKKSLQKWENIEIDDEISSKPANAVDFLEVPGKTKLIPLINLGDSTIITQLGPADVIFLKAHNHRVCVYTKNDKYIGRLPDDVAARLKKLIEHGNEYDAYIKSCDDTNVLIFVKEKKRNPKLQHIPSFSSQKIDYISFESAENNN